MTLAVLILNVAARPGRSHRHAQRGAARRPVPHLLDEVQYHGLEVAAVLGGDPALALVAGAAADEVQVAPLSGE